MSLVWAIIRTLYPSPILSRLDQRPDRLEMAGRTGKAVVGHTKVVVVKRRDVFPRPR